MRDVSFFFETLFFMRIRIRLFLNLGIFQRSIENSRENENLRLRLLKVIKLVMGSSGFELIFELFKYFERKR